jgi:glycosyltransferase involved in cell wall biosynthesis
MIHSQKVSVVTIVKEDARFLKTAFKSFAYQDYTNLEWIIVHDASSVRPNKSAALLQKYRARDKRVRLYLNTALKDQTDLYAFAVSKASGDYIAFLEPDSVWVKDKISRQLGFMKRYTAIMGHTSYAFIDDQLNLLPVGCAHVESSVNLINFKKTTDLGLSTVMLDHEEIKDFFPINADDKKTDFLMYLMKKGVVSQGMSDVMTLCRPDFSFPHAEKQVESAQKLYRDMNANHENVPSLVRFQAVHATNIASIVTDPSTVIGKDVTLSLDEMKHFKL